MSDVTRAIESALYPLDFATVLDSEIEADYWEEGHRILGEYRGWQVATDGIAIRIIAPDGAMYSRIPGLDDEDEPGSSSPNEEKLWFALSTVAIDMAIEAKAKASGQLDLFGGQP